LFSCSFFLHQGLSIPQIYRIGTMFWDDKYGAQGLSAEVSPGLQSHAYFSCIFSVQIVQPFKFIWNMMKIWKHSICF